ncbi:MAG TPA: DMT family transporter [Casimicrobiaceae bacterium]|nr:DMT family transporter [Casimicrobiaceae bacterium]
MTLRSHAAIGPLFAVIGVLGFSFKAILVKLAYAAHPVLDAATLLTWRMIYAAPLFTLMAWFAERQPGAIRMQRRDVLTVIGLGFIGYYLSSYLDFAGLHYITASLERLIVFTYPAIVVLLSAFIYRKPVTRRTLIALVLCYIGVVLVFLHDLRVADSGRDVALGGFLVFMSAILYAIYLVFAGPAIARLGSQRFIAWAMLTSSVFVFGQFALIHPITSLAIPPAVHWLSLTMAVFSTVLPTWLMAEALKRIGASRASIVGSLGPVFTIGFGAMLLDEPMHAIQLAGAALVLAGVWQVTQKPSTAREAQTTASP